MLTNNSAEWDKQIQDVVKAYESLNAQTKVNVLNIADANYATKLNTQALAGTLPDLYYTRSFDIAPQVRDGWLAPISKLNAETGDPIGLADFIPAVEAQFSQNGELYAVPEGLSAYGIYVNKTMFEEMGIPVPTGDWTWTEYYEIAEAFKVVEGGRQVRWGGHVNGSSWGQLGVMMANGGSVFDESGTTASLATDENVETYAQINAAVQSGAIPATAGLPEGVDPFAAGFLAMFMNGSWYAGGAREAIGDKFEWEVVPLPKGTTGKREVATAGGGWSMSSNAKDVDAAWSFLSYLGSADVMATIPYAADSPITARSTDTYSTSNFPDIGDDAAAILYPTVWASYEIAWYNRLASLIDGTDPRGVLTQIQEEANR